MEHKLARGALGVSSKRNDTHRRNPPATTVPLAMSLDARVFMALDPGVQG